MRYHCLRYRGLTVVTCEITNQMGHKECFQHLMTWKTVGSLRSILKVEGHPKLLISQIKFSGPRKFILRYQQFGMNFDFDVSRVDDMR